MLNQTPVTESLARKTIETAERFGQSNILFRDIVPPRNQNFVRLIIQAIHTPRGHRDPIILRVRIEVLHDPFFTIVVYGGVFVHRCHSHSLPDTILLLASLDPCKLVCSRVVGAAGGRP